MEPAYAFIGGGNMGRALVGGLIAAGHPRARITVADPIATCREACAASYGVAVTDDNAAAVVSADVVVLAVKPQQLRTVAQSLGAQTRSQTLFVSIAAGITLSHLESWLGAGRAIVRAMPNTPAQIGAGAAALCANATVDTTQRARATQLLEAVGVAVWLDNEGLMDAVTALSGSGPAYVFLLIELLARAGHTLGLEPALAARLALATVAGAGRLAAQAECDAATLRQQVTSPGGTTERALASFSADDLAGVVLRALTAARDRGQELARMVEA